MVQRPCKRCYNAAMSGKPFWIHVRRLLVVAALFCVAAALFVKSGYYYHDIVLEEYAPKAVLTYDCLTAAGFAFIGAGIGTIFRKPFLFAGIVLAIELVRSMIPVVY